MTAIQGALIPVVAWFIGRKIKTINFSWSAAVLFTFYPVYVLHSHYITVDIPLTLFTLLVILFSLNYLESGKNFWLILACLMVSVATMEKYPGILSFGIILATIGLRALRKDQQKNSPSTFNFWKSVGICIAVVAIGILLIGFPLFLNFETAWKQIVQEARPDHLGSDGLGWAGNLLYYLKDFYFNADLIVSLIAALGLISVVSIGEPWLILLFFGGGYWIALSILPLHHSRWSLPMMTTPLFLAAIGVSFLWHKVSNKPAITLGFVALLIAGFVPYILKGTVRSVMLTMPDTRNEALHYLAEHGITAENTISDGCSPYNPSNKNDIYDIDILNSGDKKYMITSSLMEDRYAREPKRYSKENAFYRDVRSHSVLIR